MGHAERVVRVVSSSLASFVATLFAAGYNYVQYHNLVEHGRWALPNPTQIVVWIVPWVFVVPLAVFVAGMALRKRQLAVRIVTAAGWLFALAWPLACIWAWELPHVLL